MLQLNDLQIWIVVSEALIGNALKWTEEQMDMI